MTGHAERARDIAIASAGSMLSLATRKSKIIHDFWVGSDSPSYVPTWWRLIREPHDEFTNWVTFRGDPEAGLRQSQFKTAGMLAIRKSSIDQLNPRGDKYHALAFAAGSAVLVGALPVKLPAFAADDQGARHYVAAMRIGRGDLEATAGVWDPVDKRFQSPEESQAVTAMRTIAIADLPAAVPLV